MRGSTGSQAELSYSQGKTTEIRISTLAGLRGPVMVTLGQGMEDGAQGMGKWKGCPT